MKLKLITFLFVLTIFSLSIPTAHAFYFSDNFDSYGSLSNLASNWNDVPAASTLDATGGYNGSKAIKFTYAGEKYFPLVKSIASAGTDHVYVKFKFKVNSNAVGGIKFLKIFGVIGSGPSYANWTWNFGPTTKTPSTLTALCYGEGGGLQNDTNVCIYPNGSINGPAGSAVISELSGTLFTPTPGQWYEVSTYNRYSTNGASNGEMWMEVDGKRILHVINAKNRNDANSRVIGEIHFADYSNPNANMTISYDNIEISDSPLSTKASTLPAPTGLRIASQVP